MLLPKQGVEGKQGGFYFSGLLSGILLGQLGCNWANKLPSIQSPGACWSWMEPVWRMVVNKKERQGPWACHELWCWQFLGAVRTELPGSRSWRSQSRSVPARTHPRNSGCAWCLDVPARGCRRCVADFLAFPLGRAWSRAQQISSATPGSYPSAVCQDTQ